MGKTAKLLLIALLLTAAVNISVGQEQVLQVHVVTPEGVPKQGIIVTASLGGVTARAVTNATGWAVFGGLQPGVYTLTAYLSELELNTTTVDFPTVSSLDLVVPLGSLQVSVVDLGGRPVPNTVVTVSGMSGRYDVTQRTNGTGQVVFENVPYTTLATAGGPYNVRVVKEGITVGSTDVRLESSVAKASIRAKILNLNITALDRSGSPLKSPASITLKAGDYSQQASLKDGKAFLTGLISSEVVGEYRITASMKVGDKDVTIYSDTRQLTLDIELEIEVDVGNIMVNVLDDTGKPIPGIVVVINSASLGQFAGGRTDNKGQLQMIGIPLSKTEAGNYNLTAYRGRSIVSVQPLSLETGQVTVDIVIRLSPLEMKIVDASGAPVQGAEVRINDPLTGRNSTGITGEDGVVGLSAFAGPNDLQVIYKNVVVFARRMDIVEGPMTVRVTSVNFPISIYVLDALGRPANGFQASVTIDGKKVFEGVLTGQPLTVNSELPGWVRVDVLSDGRLLARETAFTSGETRLEIRFSNYLFAGGGLIPFELVVATAIGVIMLAVIALAIRSWRYARQH
jgi:hypothetical protein